MEAQAIKPTQEYITIKDLELLKRELKLWTVGLMMSSFVLLAGFITFLDNRTQNRLDRMDDHLDRMEQKIETRFQTMETRFQTMETRFQAMETRFQAMEKDIKTILLILSPNQLNTDKANTKLQANPTRKISQK